MSRSSRSRAFSRRSRVSSSVLWARPPLPGNAVSPCVSNSSCHLYRWLRRKPNSRATAAAGRPDDFHSRTASILNSVVNCCRFAIGHLPGAIVPFLRCPRKVGLILLFQVGLVHRYVRGGAIQRRSTWCAGLAGLSRSSNHTHETDGRNQMNRLPAMRREMATVPFPIPPTGIFRLLSISF